MTDRTPARATEPGGIELRDVTKRYRTGSDRPAVAADSVSVHIEPGALVALAGPSGSGKSTLLHLVGAIERPDSGTIINGSVEVTALHGSALAAYRRTVGFVFQDFRLIPRFTVFQNVAFVMRVLGVPVTTQQRKTFQVLKWVGLQHRMNAHPEELSGGEQQRVAIARALVNDPQIVLADEPTGNLDPDLSLEIMNLFREINARGTTVVVATHDRELIRRVGRRSIALANGRIAEVA
jgi:cell division transport system ATP-binding protein